MKLVCRVLNETGMIDLVGEKVGYDYRNVLMGPDLSNVTFEYQAVNYQTRMALMNPDSV